MRDRTATLKRIAPAIDRNRQRVRQPRFFEAQRGAPSAADAICAGNNQNHKRNLSVIHWVVRTVWLQLSNHDRYKQNGELHAPQDYV